MDVEKFEFLLRIGDDAWVLGRQLAQWLDRARGVEGQAAQERTARELAEQARGWLGYAAQVEGAGRSEDDLLFGRQLALLRHHSLVARPASDAPTLLMRQYLFDAWHLPLLEGLSLSVDGRIAQLAGQACIAVAEHLRHSREQVLGLGAGPSAPHAQLALNALWDHAEQLFVADAATQAMASQCVIARPSTLERRWRAELAHTLARAQLCPPG